jgi:histidinol-phosphate aminotransferase
MKEETTTIMPLIRPSLVNLKPYSSARDEFDSPAQGADQQFVYLDANENPFNSGYNRYPDPHQRVLKDRMASLKNVQPSQIFIGNGSDEAIDLLIRMFCEPGIDNILIPSPTYGMYEVSAAINNVGVRKANLKTDFTLDAAAVLSELNDHTKIIFLCSPNNPSGNLLKEKEVEKILTTFKGITIIDEAYIDFSGSKSWSLRLSEFPRLIILQTLSKAWGLAGIRLGMAFANKELIELLNMIKPPYNISSLSQEIAIKALSAPEIKDQSVSKILSERHRLTQLLGSVSSIRFIFNSDANFLLVRMTNASAIYQRLVQKKIVVRDRSKVLLCHDCLRITVGTKEENDKLIYALREI